MVHLSCDAMQYIPPCSPLSLILPSQTMQSTLSIAGFSCRVIKYNAIPHYVRQFPWFLRSCPHNAMRQPTLFSWHTLFSCHVIQCNIPLSSPVYLVQLSGNTMQYPTKFTSILVQLSCNKMQYSSSPVSLVQLSCKTVQLPSSPVSLVQLSCNPMQYPTVFASFPGSAVV